MINNNDDDGFIIFIKNMDDLRLINMIFLILGR